MRDLIIIQSAPLDSYYLWQTHIWLESLKNIGKSNKALSLIYVPKGREKEIEKWSKLISLYPEAKFEFIKDEHNINSILGIYIPIIRPYCLWRYWENHPEMVDKALFYCDNDIFFLSNFNIDNYIYDDINYVSDTRSYLAASYFDSKIKDVKLDKLEEFKKIDVLDEITKLVGINRQIAVKNELNTGGAQYLLKNINRDFWDRMMTSTLKIRKYLQNTNRAYFESESKGYQSWVADMAGLLWELWRDKKETKIIPEMDFAWSSDPISKLDKVGIFHNAGIVSELQGDIPVFYKGKYHQGKDPFKDPHLEYLSTNEKNKTLCNHYYVEKLIELRDKYKL